MITKKPLNLNENIHSIHFTESARIAFKYILNILFREKGNLRILIPSYIGITDREGSGVFDPIIETSCEYSFYKLNSDLSINFNDLIRSLKQDRFNALLVIHYFGFFQSNLNTLKDICMRYEVTLIEDCAHSYNSSFDSKAPGEIGDFSFFSVHKFLSTLDGGILKVNNEDYNPIEISEDDKMSFETLEILTKSNIKSISEIRRNNFSYLLDSLNSLSFLEPMYEDLQDGIVPMNLPVRIKNHREKIYFELMKRNFPTISLYYRLIEEIKPSSFPEMYNLSKEILNFPIHQEIEKSDIDLLINELHHIRL